MSNAGLSILSPEIQLLYKSSGLRDKDLADFQAVRGHLTESERDWLRAALEMVSPGHPWVPQRRQGIPPRR